MFRLCAVKTGEVVAILSETQTRPILPQLSELALHQLEARPFHVVVSSPEVSGPVPIRSTGTSLAVGGLEPVIKALAVKRHGGRLHGRGHAAFARTAGNPRRRRAR